MDVFDLVAKITLDSSEYEKGLGDIKGGMSKFGSALGAAGKASVAAIAAASTAVGVLTKKSIDAYAEFEQLEGGVKKLYQGAADELMQYANNAYATSGMSANQYMEQATSFSAALINSLGGDFSAAAKQTDVAMRAISDNVNTFGTDMGSVSQAFQGFAKQNYTMLDNLKLGYGGTKQEMERLIADANEYAKANGMAADLSIDSFSDIVTAIDLVQQKQGIAGTTAAEAAKTIEGSLNMTKAAWKNLVAGFANPNADIGQLMDNLVTAIVGDKEGEGLLNQIIPAIQRAFEGIGQLLQQATPILSEQLPPIIESILPALLSAATTLISGIVTALPSLIQVLVDQIPTVLMTLADALTTALPMFGEVAPQIIATLATGIATSLPILIPAMVQAVLGMVQGLLDNIDLLIDAAIELIKGLAEGLITAIPELIARVPEIIASLASALIEAIPELLPAAGEIMASIGQALCDAAPESLQDVIDAIGNAFESAWEAIQAVWEQVEPFFEAIWEAIKAIWDAVEPFFTAIFQSAWEGIKGIWSSVGSFFSGVWNTIKGVFSAVGSFFGNAFRTAVNNIKSAFGNIVSFFQGKWNSIKNVFSNAGSWFRQVGSQIVSGIRNGISSGWQALTNWIAEKARSLLNAAKSALGIASPSKVFRDEVGKMITLGIADGIVSKDAMRALDTATAELTGDSVKDLEKMVKAWDDVYDSYYDGLEHQNFFLELAGDTDGIIANYRKMQETLHEQKEHYLRMGVDANDSAIRDMEEQWWDYQDKIDGVYDGIAKKAEQAYDTMIDVMEHKLFLSEKQGKSPKERLAILEQLMEETHKRADVLRSQGYTDDSKEIRELQKQWWGYHDELEGINDGIIKKFQEIADAAQEAYDKAFDAIMDKQKTMQDKLAGYGELYKSTTTTSGKTYVSLQDLDRQTKQLERYGEIIEELRSRGVSGSLMEDILGMGIDEGSEFGKRLLNMSEGGLNDYLASYQRKQDIAADISARYYKPEFDALNGQNVELNVAEQRNLEYNEEQTSLLRRIAETFEGSGGQTVQVVVDGQVIANATFDDIVAVSKMRGLDIVNVKEG